MGHSGRFLLAVNLLAIISILTVVVAEYQYDAYSAVLSMLPGGMVVLAALLSFGRSGRRLPPAVRAFLGLVTFICVVGFTWVLLVQQQSKEARAFSLGHFALVIMACKLFRAYRTRDYASILVLSLLLMVIGAVTCDSMILAVPFVLYTFLGGYCLVLYQLQRQAELAAATYVDVAPLVKTPTETRAAESAFWGQLRSDRFGLVCGGMMVLTIVLAGVFFLCFPRVEPGLLMGGRVAPVGVSGFSDEIILGSIDKNRTRRQVVARVGLSDDGEPLGSYYEAFYLRCVALDRYGPMSIATRQFRWSRSSLLYYERKLPCGTIEDRPDMIKQEIALTGWDEAYLPGLYRIRQIDYLPCESLRLNKLDAVASRSLPSGRRSTLLYTIGSAPPGLIDANEVRNRFNQQLLALGRSWLNYGTDQRSATGEIYVLADEIAGDLARQRRELHQVRQEAFARWQRLYGRELPSAFFYRPWRGQLKEDKDPNISAEDMAFIDDLYHHSSKLAVLDRRIVGKIMRYLSRNYSYSLERPDLPADDETEPISAFLSETGNVGNCEYFASAMVMLCRALGLQARLAVGYLAHEYVQEFDYYLVRQRDAHCWAEIYTADQDWLRFDATPTESQAAQTAARGPLAELIHWVSNYLEQVQFRWLKFAASGTGRDVLQWATGMSDWLGRLESSTQVPAQSRTARIISNWFMHRPGESFVSLFVRWMIFFCTLTVLAIIVRELLAYLLPKYTRWRTRRRNLKIYDTGAIGFYRQMLQTLQAIGIHKERHLTPREFALRVTAYGRDFAPVGFLSEMYYRVRFGRCELDREKQENLKNALNKLRVFVASSARSCPRPWEEQG